MDMIVQGMIAAATVLWLLSYFGFRRVFGFIMVVDIVVTVGFIIAFSGSYAGMMTGVIAGMITSMFLRVGRSMLGYSTPRFIRRSGDLFPSMVWVRRR
jgi:hypothetical protein